MSKIAKNQKFEIETINRKDIKNADYNPRVINSGNKKRLKKALKDHGLVEPLTWNRRTGNLIAGHQRIEILDALEKSQDYLLTVSVLDVSPEEEKALNVQMNNLSMMGEWDFDKLKDLAADSGLDFIDDFNFFESEVRILIDGDDRFSSLMLDTADVEKEKDTLRDIKKDRAEMNEKLKKENAPDYFFMVVCESEEQKKSLLKQMGILPGENFIGAYALERLAPSQDKAASPRRKKKGAGA
jgi:hypothetical protein